MDITRGGVCLGRGRSLDAEPCLELGEALARESFAFLDDFLPLADVQALASAVRQLKPKMAPGQTDSMLSASGGEDRNGSGIL